MKAIILWLIFVLLGNTLQTLAQTSDPKYFHEHLPDTTPRVFAPGRISMENGFEFGSVFSHDRSEFYYGVDIDGKAETRMMKFENEKWGQPVTILFNDVYSYNDPFLTPDNMKLYFISDRPLSGSGLKKDYDIWYVERLGENWSEPKNAGPNINSDKNEYYISFTESGRMYFASNKHADEGTNNYDIYSSDMMDDDFQSAVKLDHAINTPAYEADVFVAPDESYIVFAANRPGGLGRGDLYVSFRMPDGTWTPSKSLGNSINTPTNDFCPYVTPDGKYLFYSSRGDLYWVSTDVIRKMH